MGDALPSLRILLILSFPIIETRKSKNIYLTQVRHFAVNFASFNVSNSYYGVEKHMKLQVASIIALCGITALSCNLTSQAPSLSATPTPSSDTASTDSISGGDQSNSSWQIFSLDNVDAIPPADVEIEIA
jgi:hypothetical protein